MESRKVFVKWWIIFMLVCFGIAMILVTGLAETINRADITKLSFLIGGLFVYFSIRAGIVTYQMDRETIRPAIVKRYVDSAKFASNLFIDLGMIGTVIGFIYMLSTSFGHIELANTASLHSALQSMGAGMSTALFTTAAGLVCSVLLRIQLYLLVAAAKEAGHA